jgi:hypothetical protein
LELLSQFCPPPFQEPVPRPKSLLPAKAC